MGWFSHERRWRSPERSPGEDAGRTLRRKFTVLGGVAFLAFFALTCQLFRLQVLDVGHYQLLAQDNRLLTVPLSAPRGLVYDRNGRPLAENVAEFSAVLTPAYLPKGRESDVYSTLESLLHVPAYQIEQRVDAARKKNNTLTPITIKTEIDKQTAMILRGRRDSLPGVDVAYKPVRNYPAGEAGSHLLGYIGPLDPDETKAAAAKGYLPGDDIGKAGVELQYENYLRGAPGRQEVEVDASGQWLRTLDRQAPRAGDNLTMSLDLDLQQAVSDILQESVQDLASKKAAAIVMDVRTGELLADVSLPTYDDNIFSHPLDEAKYEALTSDPDKPLLDHAIAEKYPPGSTFKIVTGLAALQEGVITPSTTITSKHALLVPREDDPTQYEAFPEWNPVGLGPLDFYGAIAESSDIYFYCVAGGHCDQLQNGLGNEALAKYAKSFGFGELTGVDLPGETDGLIGDTVWLKKATGQTWYLADTFYQGIGQGYVEATPMQVVRMVSAVANGGTLLRPKAVREVRDADGNVIIPARPDVVGTMPVSPQNLSVMREAMRQSAAHGTAASAQAMVPGVPIGGKTGTAEFGQVIGAGSVYGQYKEHGWFTGFAPFNNPEIAVVVFHDQGGGALTAAPTAGRILKAYFDLKQRRAAGAAAPTPAPSATPTPPAPVTGAPAGPAAPSVADRRGVR